MKKLYISIIIATLFLHLSFIVSAQKNKVRTTLYDQVNKENMNRWVDSVFNQMSREERIGQLFMPIVAGDNTAANRNRITELINNQYIGGILFSKGTPTVQAELTNAAQRTARVPLMITLDGEWGLSMRLENTPRFPRNMMLGAIQNDSLLFYYGLEVARQCKLMGIHVNFAPDMDVNSNPNNPVIGTRSFGENPERVSRLGIMYAKGLEAGGVMAVAKHFPGHGDTSADSHKVLPIVPHNRARLDNVELYTFRNYINAGLSGMMIGHLDVPALDKKRQPSSLSKAITSDLLQSELDFSGLIFTDGLQMKGVSTEDNYCVRALLAGNDILLGPVNVAKEYNAVKNAVQDRILSDSLINSKCKKVLSYKYILGVHNTQPIKTTNLVKELNAPQADLVNRNLNRGSITLAKNSNNIIPLRELDQRRIAAVSIGEDSDNTFHRTLKKYGNITCFNLRDSDALLRIKKQLESFNTIIVSIHNTNQTANAAIQNVCKGKETILAFFIQPYRLSSYNSAIKDAESVILAYENNSLSQDYAAQAIFGGNDVTGKLPVSVGDLFKEGDGYDVRKVRVAYGLPEEVGMSSERLEQKIESIVNEGIKAQAFPGCQILIAKDGIVIYNHSFGSFEYNNVQKATDDDIYDLASMTKATATLPAIMKLYDGGNLKLSNAISDYVPILKNTDKSKITIREALLHETGLPSFIPYYMNAIDETSYQGKLFNTSRTSLYSILVESNTWARRDYKTKPEMISLTAREGFLPLGDNMYVNKNYSDVILNEIANAKMSKRKTSLYSCLNFMLLKEVVEKISNEDLNSYVQENFFQKLGATTTTYNPLTKFSKNQIVPTERDNFFRKQLIRGYVHDEGAALMGGISGNAGLFSNANDLVKLYQMWLNKGSYGGEQYLSEKTCAVFTNTKSSISRRGLGFDKPEMRTNKTNLCAPSSPESMYGHTGFTGTCFWIDPDNNLIYIFLSNRVYENRTHKAISTLNIRPRIQEEIYRAMRRGNDNYANQIENFKFNIENNDEQTGDE